MKYILISLCYFVGLFSLEGQEILQERTNPFNAELVRNAADYLHQSFLDQRRAAFSYARRHGYPLERINARGERLFLSKVTEGGGLIYRKSFGERAVETVGATALQPGGETGLNLTGEGLEAGIWDEGLVYTIHEIFEGRALLGNQDTDFTNHATHVAGILAGRKIHSGPGIGAQGVALKAAVISYDWDNDLSEMLTEAYDPSSESGILVSNHSYGAELSLLPQKLIGAYNNTSLNTDLISYLSPFYTIVNSSGNDGDDFKGHYNLLGTEMSTAKNDLVVAAIYPISNYGGSGRIKLAGFSSGGPTNDNRIKPDISADGVNVYSSLAKEQGALSTRAYGNLNGTSMAAPAVSGGVLLLQELSARLNNGNYLLASTIKALMVATALPAGQGEGPDPLFGWGVLNLKGAAEVLEESAKHKDAFYIESVLDKENRVYRRVVTARAETPLRVTLAWTDPPARTQDTVLGRNNTEIHAKPVLVNDLDLRITDNHGNTFYPWRLVKADPQSPALNDGDNTVDNIEKVEVFHPKKGEKYIITVTYKGELSNGWLQTHQRSVFGHGVNLSKQQVFSLVGTGVEETLEENAPQLKKIKLFPNPAVNKVFLNMGNMEGPGAAIIYNDAGQEIGRYKWKESALGQQLNVSQWGAGVYFVKIKAGGKTVTKKLIVR